MRRFIRRNYSIAHPDFEPHSVVKVISRNGKEVKKQPKHEKKAVTAEKKENSTQKESRNKVNAMGIQMISNKLFQQIFLNTKPSNINPDLIDK